MTRPGLAVALAATLALAGCGGSPDPEAAELLALYDAFEPYSACVNTAIGEVSGVLPEMVVAGGAAGEMQRLARRHVGISTAVDDLPRDAQIAATRDALLALAAYGAGRGAPAAEPVPARTRRLLGVIETSALLARVLDAPCEPSEQLVTLMEQAQNEHF